jgi:ribosomal protein S18 acetylase RimI-like enzyme
MPELSDDAKGQWRPMRVADLPRVLAVADAVHPAFPEDAAVFEERLRLYPGGCLVFSNDEGIAGYVVSHPWRANDPPALNSRLGELPRSPATYYIHDIALLPELRGTGAAALAVALLLARAHKEKLATMSLVAVNDSAGFWAQHGFRDVTDTTLARKLRGYGTAAMFMRRELA